MLRPTNAAMEHLCASQPYYTDVFPSLCMEQRSFSWRATVRGGHDDIGEGWCFTCPPRMLRPTNVTMIHVCASKPYSRHPHAPRSVSLCRDSLRATVCGGPDGIGEGWCPDSWPAIGILMLCHKVHLLLLQPHQQEQQLEQMYAALRAATHCCCS